MSRIPSATSAPAASPPAELNAQSVGYIGMGIMGSAMAANLLRAGYELIVWNRTAARCRPLVDLGATMADSPADLASRGPAFICTNVTDTPDVRQVLLDERGVIHGTRPGQIVIDHSTISPAATREFAVSLASRGVELLDAPVSGGDVGARNATLSIMVGGSPQAFQRALPALKAMGKTITHVGPSGMGQVCKACNQVVLVNALMGVCEALALAKRQGLDGAKMIEVVNGGAAQSWQLGNLGPKIVGGDFAPGFMIDLVLKDLAIVLDAGKQSGLTLHGTNSARDYFKTVATAGGGRLGTQAMAKAMEASN